MEEKGEKIEKREMFRHKKYSDRKAFLETVITTIKKTRETKEKKIYGDRICRSCKGLCHEESFRQGRRYYCCIDCLYAIIENSFKENMAKEGYFDVEYPEENFEDILKFFEKVKVISK